MTTAQMPGRYIIAAGFVLACMLLACPSVSALNPASDVSQYAHTSWKIRDGFPKGQITSIAQTPDGYLWLGTEFGLLRFDGVQGVPWKSPSNQTLPSSKITSLRVTRDGTLWIGTYTGLASWKDGKLRQYAEFAGRYIFRILEDRQGSVWVGAGAFSTAKLCVIQNANVRECYGDDGSFGRSVFGLYEDSKDNIWVGVANGLWRWKPGSPTFYPLPGEPNGIQGFGEDYDGVLLICTKTGVRRFVDGKPEAYSIQGTVPDFTARRLLRDRDGSLWIGTSERGLVHVHHGRSDVFASAGGLSGDNIYTLFEDREGNIWVATMNGLDRFRDFAVATITMNQGLASDRVQTVLAARDHSIWLGTFSDLERWNNGEVTTYPAGGGKQNGKPKGLVPYSLFQDDRGRIWVSTFDGVGYLDDDRFVSIPGVPGGNVTSMAQDASGDLWIANERAGLFQLYRGDQVRHIPWDTLGHKDHASTMVADPSRGGLWIGFHLGGVAYFADGQVRASYTAADGLSEGRVNHLRIDQDNTLWASTDGGVSRLKNGRVATLTSKNGLPCDTVHWVMEDDAHSLWLYTACGLVRIPRTEIDAWAAAVDQNKDAKHTIQSTIFDSSDGVRILSSDSHYSPLVAKSSDGKLWFMPWDGVSVIDPRHIPFNNLPPPVHVEKVTVDRKTYDAAATVDGRLPLPALSRELQIDYIALSLVAPEKNRYRYKLENWDSDWKDVGDRRWAVYNNLPPGNYRFRVMACNNSGVWNEAGTFLDLNVAPAYYQTWWFRISMLAAFVAALVAIYQMRTRQVAQQVRMRMEERLEERERIARDLHDTLLQSVQGLILKFDAAARLIPKEEPARQVIEKTLDHADQVMEEGRDRVRNLRASTIGFGGLPAAFQRVAEETPNGREATVKTVVEGRLRELHPMVREECYCIGREALVNALTHSGCHNVEIEITYESRQFRLRIRDDGHGIDPGILEDGGRPGHWGMRGMRERAQRIDAKIELWSRPGAGTEVDLIVPAAAAYVGLRSKSKNS